MDNSYVTLIINAIKNTERLDSDVFLIKVCSADKTKWQIFLNVSTAG